MSFFKNNKDDKDEEDIISSVVLDALGIGLSVGTIWPRQSEIDSVKPRLAQIREWTETLENKKIKKAYIGWLDYFDKEVTEAEEELHTQKHKKESEEFWVEHQDKQRRINEYKEYNPIPVPPQWR